MSQRDDQWGPEDDGVVRRLRDEKPRISEFELDGVKTRVTARMRRAGPKRATPRLSLLVALLTFGAMVAGTAGTIAAGSSSVSSATGAAQSQYRPPKCNPKHEECTCPGGSIRKSRDRCECPAGQTFAEGTNDCRCPNGSNPTDGKCGKCPDHRTEIDGKCVPRCPDGSVRADSGRCVCPDHGTLVDGRCVRRRHPRAIPQSTSSTVRTTRSPKHR
jgi:hypothetical protein